LTGKNGVLEKKVKNTHLEKGEKSFHMGGAGVSCSEGSDHGKGQVGREVCKNSHPSMPQGADGDCSAEKRSSRTGLRDSYLPSKLGKIKRNAILQEPWGRT